MLKIDDNNDQVIKSHKEKNRQYFEGNRTSTYPSLVEIACVVEWLGGGSDNGFSKLTSTENKTARASDAHVSVSSTDHVYSTPYRKKAKMMSYVQYVYYMCTYTKSAAALPKVTVYKCIIRALLHETKSLPSLPPSLPSFKRVHTVHKLMYSSISSHCKFAD